MVYRTLGLIFMMLFASVAVTPAPATAGEWAPAKGPLMTRWAGQVSPDNVLPEYPRPQMVRDGWTNLNGLWDYAITDAADRPDEWQGEILVPFCVESALSGVMRPVTPTQTLWYRRTVNVERPADGGRTLLHFGAVDWHVVVSVNGQTVGEHKGGYDPLTFDVTDALKDGDNELLVRVQDATDTQPRPTGKQTLKPGGITYTAVTGIWQTVWLENVPQTYVRSLRITPDVDAGNVKVVVEGADGNGIECRVVAKGHGLDQTVKADGGTATVPVPDAKLWSPDAPILYDLSVELVRDGRTLDRVTSYFAMRKIDVQKDDRGHNRLFLNDEPLFQIGLLDQGWWPDGLYTAPTDEALKYDLELTKAWGFNTSRKHVKVEPARWYYHCDRMGVLVWQDMPSIRQPRPQWQRDPAKVGTDVPLDAKDAAQFRQELTGVVDALYNHPSIVMWVPFNERWGQHDTAGTVAALRELDATRPINAASGGNYLRVGDVVDVHSYPNPSFPGPDATQVVVCGEFGGLGLPVPGHVWQEKKNWGYASFDSKEALEAAYVEKMYMLRPLIGQGLAAAIYTQTTDVEIEVNGLVTYDRAVVKVGPKLASNAAAELFGPVAAVRVVVPTAREDQVQWAYTLKQPADGWMKPGFDDSSWQHGPAGFGSPKNPAAKVGTEWAEGDIWLRRTFELPTLDAAEELWLVIHQVEQAEVYVNGTKVYADERSTAEYQTVALDAAARSAFHAGSNELAIHCRTKRRPPYIDAGFAAVTKP